MAFDLATARPVKAAGPPARGGFDLTTARPVGAQDASQTGARSAGQTQQQPAWRRAIQLASDYIADPILGAGETLATMGTGAVGDIAGRAAGLAAIPVDLVGVAMGRNPGETADPSAVRDAVSGAITYRPQTQSAQGLMRTVAAPFEAFDRSKDQLQDIVTDATGSTFAGDLAKAGANASQGILEFVPGISAARRLSRPPVNVVPGSASAEGILARQAARSDQNMGAAAATPDLAGATPELKQAVIDRGRGGEHVNTDILQRHVDADRVFQGRARLTEGQASQDVGLITREQNLRMQDGSPAAQLFNDQNKALVDFANDLRERVGERVFSTRPVEHGDSLIAAYRAFDDASNARISEAYQALRDAAGGRFPIGAKTLLENVDTALRKELKTHYAPEGEMSLLRQWAAKPGSMTFEDFEAMRTNLATIQRTSTDGNVRRAAGIIRDQMEELPLLPGAGRLKGLADEARSLAKDRFARIEADPAYKAVVDENIAPDDFVRRFVVGGKRDNLTKMIETIPEARDTVGVALLDHLRGQAGIVGAENPNFAAASYARALKGLEDKDLPSVVFAPEIIEDLEALNRTAQLTVRQPRGSAVNNSNTFSAALQDAGESWIGNVTRKVPIVGGATVDMVRKRRTQREVEHSFRPGAGIDRPQTLPRPRATGADVTRPYRRGQ